MIAEEEEGGCDNDNEADGEEVSTASKVRQPKAKTRGKKGEDEEQVRMYTSAVTRPVMGMGYSRTFNTGALVYLVAFVVLYCTCNANDAFALV